MFAKKTADTRLLRIEEAGRLDSGLSSLLYKSLLNYDDSVLRAELESGVDEVGKAISVALCCDIAISASAGFIGRSEGMRMYRKAEDMVAQAATDNVKIELWKCFRQMLLKKLLILHLTREICTHRLQVASSTKSLDFFRTRAIEEPKKKIKSKQLSKGKLLRSTTPSSLHQELVESRLIQQQLDRKIASNLTLVSQTVSLGDRTSAIAFSKQVGARKLEVLLKNKLMKYYSLYFTKWKMTFKSFNAEVFSMKFMKLYGATRCYEWTEKQASNKKFRYFKAWWRISLALQQADIEVSVIKMQSVIRGGLGRKRVAKIKCHRAAIVIQKRHRGYLGRLRMEERKKYLKLCAAVRTVEKAYQKYIWVRAGKHMRTMLKRNHAAKKIQRGQRAHIATKRILHIRHQRLQRRKAIKIQAQWRRYLASVRVDGIRRKRLWLQSAISIQRVTRGMLGRLYVNDVRETLAAVLTIQCAWRSCIARTAVNIRRRNYRATLIQKLVRGRIGRRRFRIIFNAQRNALREIARGVRGYRDRRKYKPLIAAHTAKRSAAASVLAHQLDALNRGRAARIEYKMNLARVIKIQMFIRRFLFSRRAIIRLRIKCNAAARLIQRVARGYNDRRQVAELKAHKLEHEKRKQAASKVPMYYRLYEQYLRDQFLMHRPMVLRLQCFFRTSIAKMKVTRLKRIRAAKRIQCQIRRHFQTKEAKKVLEQKRLDHLNRAHCSVFIQKVIRGFLGRRRYARFRNSYLIKWFLIQLRSKGLASRVFDSFRIRKRNMARAIVMATRIQSVARGRMRRNWFRHNYKRLVKERRARILKIRNKAARKMQGLYHIFIAKKIKIKKRKERDERAEKQRVLDELEGRIDGIHGQHMLGLMTTRMQTGARAKLARKTKKQLAEEARVEAELKQRQLRYDSAVKIQALIRGIQAREKFAKDEPLLRKQRQARNFCVECEHEVATKRCRQCKDRFCENCFAVLHRTGIRRRHMYELVGPAALVTDRAAIPASNPLLWEECWDDVAQGRYWYNKQTGEASWICPY